VQISKCENPDFIGTSYANGKPKVMHLSVFSIKEWKAQPGTQKGKMVIDVYENVFEGEKSKRVFHQVVLIDIR
jgi:hypothetical protein